MEEEKKNVSEEVVETAGAGDCKASDGSENKKKGCLKKLLKFLGWTLAVLLVLLIIVIWQLDRIVTAAIPVVGSGMTGTPVEVSNVSIKLLRGDVEINGFKVGNPEKFHNKYAIEVDNFHVDANLGSLSGDVIEIECVEISGLNLDFEYSIVNGSNIGVILDHVKSVTQESSGTASGENAADTTESAESSEAETAEAVQKKVIIRKLLLSDISLTISSGVTRTSVPVILPDIEMENVGEGQNLGETIAEVLDRILTEILRVVDVKKIGDSLGDLGEDVVRGVDDTAGEAVRDVVDGAGDFIKSLPGISR